MQKFQLFLSLLLLVSCQSKEIRAPQSDIMENSYLHISHMRTISNSTMLEDIKKIDFSKFDMIWLGGDIANLTSADKETMDNADSYFDFSSTNTLWALGNHDYTDLELVEEYTGRPPFYAYYANGISFIVLDTQDSLSNIIGEQLTFFNNVMDTLKESSHLVLLSHKLIWLYGHPELNDQIDLVSNGVLGTNFHNINPNNFYEDLYPRLIEAKMGGIEIICLAGDIGFKASGFSYVSDEGISFLASGVSYLQDHHFALLFKHKTEKNVLTWEYKLLSEL